MAREVETNRDGDGPKPDIHRRESAPGGKHSAKNAFAGPDFDTNFRNNLIILAMRTIFRDRREQNTLRFLGLIVTLILAAVLVEEFRAGLLVLLGQPTPDMFGSVPTQALSENGAWLAAIVGGIFSLVFGGMFLHLLLFGQLTEVRADDEHVYLVRNGLIRKVRQVPKAQVKDLTYSHHSALVEGMRIQQRRYFLVLKETGRNIGLTRFAKGDKQIRVFSKALRAELKG